MRNHIIAVCLVCFGCDVVLVGLGVFGVAEIFSQNRYLRITLGVAGSTFVLSYGLMALRSAYKTKAMGTIELDSQKNSLAARSPRLSPSLCSIPVSISIRSW